MNLLGTLDLPTGVLLGTSAAVAGALNSVAGGGSFLTFPSLLFSGMGAIQANATSTVALWPGTVASAVAYRRELFLERTLLAWLGPSSLLGGLLGAVLLVRTPPEVFQRIIPLLLLLATVTFTFGEQLRSRFGHAHAGQRGLWLAALLQVFIAIYGGYFGGGIGLMMLATFSLIGMTDIHRMNGLKTLLASVINAVAIVTFVLARKVVWGEAAVMVLGAIAGGYCGGALARRLSSKTVRKWVIVYGWALTAYFFVRTYL
jgi:uncharacterized membrane protein YfcA